MKPLLITSIIKNFLSSIFRKNTSKKIQGILKIAEAQRRLILQEAEIVLQTHAERDHQALSQHLQNKEDELQNQQYILNAKQSHIDELTQTLQTKEAELSEKSALIDANQITFAEQKIELNRIKFKFENMLAVRSGSSKTEIFDAIKNNSLKTHILEVSRLSFERQEQLKLDAQKLAQKTLQSVYYRYQPRFVWPKSGFLVEFTSSILVEKYFSDNAPVLKVLLDGTDTSLSVSETPSKNKFFVKIVGGLGVDKEIIRLTLEECNTKKLLNIDKIASIRKKHSNLIELQILNMGNEAAKILDLKDIHPEILKLVGSLNFRTSHRQNQYCHSLEVATLAGMIAHELGVDQNLAKRSGLLHDIGKVLDYKIEGGHAVISGDYAGKYNEHENLIDTVLAHHDDKIVETPHAFILKAADAMSGARPGARVDMEDGYNRRLDGISAVVQSFREAGVTDSAIMHAGREVHVYVDNKKTPHTKIDLLARDIAAKLESEVEYPGQIRVTVIRRMEITAVA